MIQVANVDNRRIKNLNSDEKVSMCIIYLLRLILKNTMQNPLGLKRNVLMLFSNWIKDRKCIKTDNV